MPDTRLPERFLTDRRLLLLDVQHRWSYVASMAWSVSNRTDGVVLPNELQLIPGFAGESPQVLIEAGLWKSRRSKGWEITDFAATQTSAHELEVLENLRRRNREAKARERAKNSGDEPPPQGDSQPDVSMTRQRDSTGRKEGRQEKAFEKGEPAEVDERAEPEQPPSPSPERSLSVVPELAATGTDPDSWPDTYDPSKLDLIGQTYDREY